MCVEESSFFFFYEKMVGQPKEGEEHRTKDMFLLHLFFCSKMLSLNKEPYVSKMKQNYNPFGSRLVHKFKIHIYISKVAFNNSAGKQCNPVLIKKLAHCYS